MKLKIILFTLFFITCFSYIFANENLSINSKAAIAMDADSSIVLYSKNIDSKIYPASTTKILTAILAIENLDLNKSVVVSKTAIAIPWDSSSVYLKEGELITVSDLLYCLLLNSGNDAANVLAEAVSGNINSFVDLMNKKVEELGCTNTHFNNAHGYSDNNHYTTALDMAKIFKYCIQNETFVKIISTKSYIVDKTNKTNKKRYLNNTNRLILKKEDSVYARYYEYCIGGKTGYTDEAGRTLITFAKKGDKTVIAAVFGASSSGVLDARYTDAINLFEYSFNNFSKVTIAQAEEYNFNYINIDKKLNYHIGLKENIDLLLNTSSDLNISYEIHIIDNYLTNLTQETANGKIAGTIVFNISNDYQESHRVEQDLYVKNIQIYHHASRTTAINILLIILIIGIFILTLLILIKTFKTTHTHTKSRKSRRIK